MLRIRRPPRSLVAFLAVLIAVRALLGHAVNAARLAALLFFVSSIEPKPAWKFWYGAPGDQDTGRAAGRFTTWQRAGATSPKEIARLPRLKDY